LEDGDGYSILAVEYQHQLNQFRIVNIARWLYIQKYQKKKERERGHLGCREKSIAYAGK
jgi:hypothetical protein